MKLLNKDYLSEVLGVSLPAAGEMTAYTLMSIFDTMMIGNYGGNVALNAVGLSSEITASLINIFIAFGVTIGISSLVARSIGARANSLADEYATLGFTIGITLAGLISIFVFLKSNEILRIAGAKDLVLIKSTMYTKIYSVAMFLIMTVNLINAILRGYGNTYTPFFVSIVITFIKILLDMCFIYGKISPELGIEGAALASVISEFVGFLYLIFFINTYSKVKISIKYLLRLKIKRYRDIIELALPSTLQEASYSISRLLGTFIVMYAGTTAFVANQIANTVESISIMPGSGFGTAATTFVGIKFGERNLKKAKLYAYSCTFWAVFISLLFAIVFLFLPKLLIGTFISKNERETLRLGALCLSVGALEQPTIAVGYVMSGALKGAGDTKSSLYISLFTSWGIRLPLMFYFIYILKKSVIYVWWITALQWGIDAILLCFAFKNLFNKKDLRIIRN
jgi:multidrug resistance protein, MATE family